MRQSESSVKPGSRAPEGDSELSAEARATWTREALALNDRFLEEIIEAHAFCPYARPARRDGRVERRVWLDALRDLDDTDRDRVAERLADLAERDDLEVALTLFPRLEVEPRPWRHFCEAVREAIHARVGRPVFGAAAFHPRLPFEVGTPAALVPLLRRAPDPTLQLVRLDVLEGLEEGRKPPDALPLEDALKSPAPRPSLYDRIAADNQAEAQRLGIATLEAHLAALADEAAARNLRLRDLR